MFFKQFVCLFVPFQFAKKKRKKSSDHLHLHHVHNRQDHNIFGLRKNKSQQCLLFLGLRGPFADATWTTFKSQGIHCALLYLSIQLVLRDKEPLDHRLNI